jgi:hypothetical protein
MSEIKNLRTGLDLEKQKADSDRPTNYLLGAVDKIVEESDGQWTEYAPECEIQKTDYTDLMDCVTESAINALSILLQRKFELYVDRSQRFTAKMSGTTHNGNSLFGVSDSLRHDGTVEEKDWARDRSMTWNEYYKDIPASIRKKGVQFTDQFEITYEKVPTHKNALKEALKYGPVQVIGYAWASDNGLYYDYGYAPNHAFLLVGYVEGQYWIVYDSYPTDFIIDENSDKQEYIKHLSWDYQFGDALLYSIKLLPESKKNWLYLIIYMLKNLKMNFWKDKSDHSKGMANGEVFLVKDGKKKKVDDINDIMAVLEINFGIEKTDWGELGQYQTVEKL